MKVLVKILLGLATCQLALAGHYLMSQEYVDKINAAQSTWTAGLNFHEDTSLDFIKGLLGTKMNGPKLPLKRSRGSDPSSRLLFTPKEFDARKHWPHCPSIAQIYDQGNCGSCWAMGPTTTFNDRICIHLGKQVHISTEQILTCNVGAGDCSAGYPTDSWDMFQEYGTVTGGAYHSNEGCMPYRVAPCEHDVKGPRGPCNKKPDISCNPTCREGYNVSYHEDRHYLQEAYRVSGDIKKMEYEIMTNGPVGADFLVFSDFPHYKSGIYMPSPEAIDVGGHSIRIIGWGEENGVKYWLCANSWNYDWGDKGTFKILKGYNTCSIENNVQAGTPKA